MQNSDSGEGRPEIPTWVRRSQMVMVVGISIYHSNFRGAERVDEWRRKDQERSAGRRRHQRGRVPGRGVDSVGDENVDGAVDNGRREGSRGVELGEVVDAVDGFEGNEFETRKWPRVETGVAVVFARRKRWRRPVGNCADGGFGDYGRAPKSVRIIVMGFDHVLESMDRIKSFIQLVAKI